MERIWTTHDVGPGSKLPQWRSFVCEAVFELDVDLDADEALEASIRQCPLGPIALSRINVSHEQTIHRTRSAIARSRLQQFELVHMQRGSARLVHYGRDVELRAGETVLIDNRERYAFTTSAGARNLSFHIPAGWLQTWIPNVESAIARPIGPQSRWGLALRAAVDAIADADSADAEPLHQLCAAQLAGALALATAPAEAPGVPNAGTRYSRKLYLRLRETLADRFHDSGLGAAHVAESNRISVRYLHAVFAAANTTFGNELLAIRLEQAARMLRDPRFDELSVSEVAWRCGFCHASHFSRCFRRQFGSTPGAFRALRGRC